MCRTHRQKFGECISVVQRNFLRTANRLVREVKYYNEKPGDRIRKKITKTSDRETRNVFIHDRQMVTAITRSWRTKRQDRTVDGRELVARRGRIKSDGDRNKKKNNIL